MDFALDDEQQLIVSTIRRLVDKELGAWAADADRAGAPPDRLLDVAGEVGFLVDAVPADADGLLEGDYSHATRALRGIELGRGCSALAALLECNVEPALAVATWGSDAARAALYGALTDGKLATTTSDWSNALTIDASGDDLTITGVLGPVPCLANASYLLLCAGAGDEPVLALVDTQALSLDPVVPSGWRAAAWATLRADGARVPADFVLARGMAAHRAIDQVLSWYRVSLAARAVGAAQAAMTHARGYAEERVQFGQPIGRFESLIGMRDQSETATAAARALVLQAAWELDADMPDAASDASRARDFAGATLARAAIDAVQIYGGYGFVNDYPVEKIMRDARAYEVLLGNEGLLRVLAQKGGE